MQKKSSLYTSTTLLAAWALGGAALTAGAAAQETEMGDMETVVVTGFRESLANALSKKERSNLIIESVAPEDIGKMPDMNVAESLQRLPGVQIDRADGEGTQIRIRGLSYNLTTLDGEIFVTGREMYQTGEASGGGNGNEFQNSMETIPSGLISGIDVYKSPDASLVAGGMGGTIDLHSLDALAQPEGFSINGILKGSYGQNASHATPSATIVASYKFNDQLALTGSIAWDHTQTRTYEMQAANRSNWAIAGGDTGYPSNTSAYTSSISEEYIEPEMMYLTNRLQTRKRFSTYVGVEYNPTDRIETSLKWFHTDMRTDTRDISDKLNFSPMSDGLGLDADEPYSIDKNGVVLYGTFNSTITELSTMVDKDKDLADNVHFRTTWHASDTFNISLRVAYGRGVANSQFAQQDQELSAYGISSSSTNNYNNTLYTVGGTTYVSDSLCGGNDTNMAINGACSFTYKNHNGIYPIISYNNPSSLTDINNGLFKSAWAWAIGDHNTQTAYRLDADYTPFERLKVTGGIRYGVRALDYWYGRYLLWNPNVDISDTSIYDNWTYYQDPGIAGVPIITFADAPERLKLVKKFFPQAGLNRVLVQDPAQMIKCPSCWLATYDNLNDYDMQFFKDPTNSFRVDNKNWSGFFMLDIGDPADDLHINTGVRVIQTQLTVVQGGYTEEGSYYGSASWNGVPVAGDPTITSRSYTDVLPSLNVVYRINDQQKLRLAAARVMADQNYWQLGQGKQYYYTRGADDSSGNARFMFDNGSAGNPNLDPYRANQVDLTYEYYFGKQGLLSVGLFYKGVESFTTQTSEQVTVEDDFGGTQGTLTTYENGGGGRIEGLELSAQYAFTNGFGFNFNYTYAQSKTQVSNAYRDHLPFPGVSNNAFTLQAYYEGGPFEAHVSYTWKGKSFASNYSSITTTAGAEQWAVYNRAYGQVDAQITWKFVENAALVLEGRNLGGDATSQYLRYDNQPFFYDQSGRRISLDLKFNY